MQPNVGGDFNGTGIKTSCVGGTATAPGRTIICSRVIAGGAQAFLKKWAAKVVDVGNADQIYFAIMRNSNALQSGMERIPAVQFDFQAQIDLNVRVYAGTVDIVAFNISGMLATLEPDALPVAVAINCQAWWIGDLLSERGGIK